MANVWVRDYKSWWSDDGDDNLDVVKTVNWMIVVLQQSWHQRYWRTSSRCVLWAQSFDFRGENPRSDLHWLCLAMTDRCSSSCWRHCLEFSRTFFGVKTLDPWSERRLCLRTISFLEASFWRTYFAVRMWSLVVVVPAASLIFSVGVFLFFFFVWLCASLMSWLDLDIMLLQRLGVIDSFILIYSLYLNKMILHSTKNIFLVKPRKRHSTKVSSRQKGQPHGAWQLD